MEMKPSQLVAIIHEFHQQGWSQATSTNYSMRLEQNVLISRSGIDKGDFTQADFMTVDLEGNPIEPIDATPSAETLLHTMVYQMSDANVVLHTHSVNATVLSLKNSHEGALYFTGYEMLKGLPGVEDHQQTVGLPIFDNSQDMAELSQDIADFWHENPEMSGFILAGHGLYTWGKDLKSAKRHIEVYEFLFECMMKK